MAAQVLDARGPDVPPQRSHQLAQPALPTVAAELCIPDADQFAEQSSEGREIAALQPQAVQPGAAEQPEFAMQWKLPRMALPVQESQLPRLGAATRGERARPRAARLESRVQRPSPPRERPLPDVPKAQATLVLRAPLQARLVLELTALRRAWFAREDRQAEPALLFLSSG